MKRLLIILFVTVISLPLAVNLAGVDGADPGAENRELAAFPHLDGTLASIAALPAGFSAWFDDHFAFRSRLVRCYGESRLFVLGVSPSAAVVKGEHGWFFYGDDKSIEDYANVEPMTDGALANWRAAILRARDWLSARNIAYVFTIAPDKYVIYPEEMPATLTRSSLLACGESSSCSSSGSTGSPAAASARAAGARTAGSARFSQSSGHRRGLPWVSAALWRAMPQTSSWTRSCVTSRA